MSEAEKELRRALMALRLEVPETVAEDVLRYVESALAERDETIAALKQVEKGYDTMFTTLGEVIAKLQGDNGVLSRENIALKSDNKFLYDENDRLYELFPNGESCACNYAERGVVCSVHQVYLEKIAAQQIAALKAEVEFQKQIVQADLKCIERLNAEIAALKAEVERLV